MATDADVPGSRAPMPKRSGLREVARSAGVSVMTVSRVANGQTGVGEDTRRRVMQVMHDLGFVPNTTARTLKTGRARTLGFLTLTSEMQGPLIRTMGSVEQAARRHGYSLMVASFPTIDRDSVKRAYAQFQGESVEAVIAISPRNESADALDFLARRIPTVGIWTPAGPVEAVAAPDNELGAELATAHLLGLGHPTVWHVAGPAHWMATDHRIAGWRRTLERASAPAPDPVHGSGQAWSAGAGFDAGMRLLADPRVSAVYVADDRLALGVLYAAHRLGRRVPDDVSVVGYDDIPESAYYLPALTTVHEQFELLGEAAVVAALARLGAVEGVDTTAPKPWLVVRETTSRAMATT